MNVELTTVNRKIRTSNLKDVKDVQRAVAILTDLPGMIEVKADSSGQWFRVHYDVTKLKFTHLLQALEAEDLMKEPGWWERIRSSCYSYQDTNIRDNAGAKSSPCCSNPKEILAQSQKK